MKDDTIYIYDINGRMYDMIDFSANMFAESILMPECVIEDTLKTTKSVHRIAKYFGVPFASAKRRLEYLGYKIDEL